MRPTSFHSASDEALLSAGADGPEAFGAFYDPYEAKILAFFILATGRADLAADLTAEVFATALVARSGFDPSPGSAGGWLYGIARHQLSDMWRNERVADSARRRLGMEPIAVTDDELDRIVDLGQHRALDLLADLPPEQRVAVQGQTKPERIIRSPATIRKLTDIVNRMPLAQPGVGGCGGTLYDTLRDLSFRSSTGDLVALLVVSPSCGFVTARIHGKTISLTTSLPNGQGLSRAGYSTLLNP